MSRTPTPPPRRSTRTPVNPSRQTPTAAPPTTGDGAVRRHTDPRSRWLGIAAVGAAGVVALVMTVGVFLPALGEVLGGAPRLADPSALPARILVCGREYTPAVTGAGLTLADVRAQDGREPVVVSAEDDAGCPADACVEGGLCIPVVYVRTAGDRYLAYGLDESEP